jgi:glucose-1-phosphate cytidylyltransferase
LIEKRLLRAVPYDGFWQSMDTFKDKILLDQIVERGRAPWQLWRD